MSRLYPQVKKVVSPNSKNVTPKIKGRNSIVLVVCLVIAFFGLLYLLIGAFNQPPSHYSVKFTTTKGVFIVDIDNGLSPHGADRLYRLVQAKYFDNSAFFRVVPHFICQFGIAATPAQTAMWIRKYIPDDPIMQNNAKGTVVFATAGPNYRSTQLFINLKDNYDLDARGFSPLGHVASGMDVVNNLYGGYGDITIKGGHGPNMDDFIDQGNAYLKNSFPKLDYIISATIVR